jgi:hypothetical protein
MEFRFELALAAHLEATTDWVIARQLGAAVADPGSRIMDLCAIRPDDGFDDRAAITSRTIPPLAVESDVGAGAAVDWRDAFDCSVEHARSVVDRAVDCGWFEVERRNGRRYVRQTTRYPDWIDSIVGVENKPDLDRPGDLDRQLRVDIALGLFDEVILATESYVTRAHLNRLPEPVGVWRFDPESGERTVVREPAPLSPDEPGIEPTNAEPLRTDIAIVDTDAKTRQRRRIAERAYGKGWRVDDLPACEHAAVTDDGRPYCAFYDRVVDPATDCGESCPAHEPAEPPDANLAAIREKRSPWIADPEGIERQQSGLQRFL